MTDPKLRLQPCPCGDPASGPCDICAGYRKDDLQYRCSGCGIIASGPRGLAGTDHRREMPATPQHTIQPDGSVVSIRTLAYMTGRCGTWRPLYPDVSVLKGEGE